MPEQLGWFQAGAELVQRVTLASKLHKFAGFAFISNFDNTSAVAEAMEECEDHLVNPQVTAAVIWKAAAQ